MSGRQRLSLKGQALKYLAMREHSRQELRRKLLPHAKAACAPSASPDDEAQGSSDSAEAVGPCLDKLLDWLEAHDLLSQERFVESRVRTRSTRFGASRIKQELSQHGVALSPDQRAELDRTEVERAREVWRRKFGQAPHDAAAHARQARFLAARGFAPDAIRRVLRSASRDDEAGEDA